jgi:hypothetical protein
VNMLKRFRSAIASQLVVNDSLSRDVWFWLPLLGDDAFWVTPEEVEQRSWRDCNYEQIGNE